MYISIYIYIYIYIFVFFFLFFVAMFFFCVFYMVRSILLQRGHLAARRVIQGDCRDYVPEVQLLRYCDDEVISDNASDGTVLHDCFY